MTHTKNTKTVRCAALILSCLLILTAVTACKGGDGTEGGVRMLSFAEASSVSEMEKLDGKEVSIIGYMSTLSPISGAFMYLMNLPYQSCPFCVPNTTVLSNTIAVYAKSAKGFEFTDRAILVTGVLEFGDYTDEYGYEYGYRIKDATYEILDTDDMSESLRLWQQLASSGAVAEMYTMLEYVNFVCLWPTYTATFQGGKDYVYPPDAISFIEDDGMQFHYGFEEGYFDSIRRTVLEIDGTAFSELILVINGAEALANEAYAALKAGEHEECEEYSGAFGDGRLQYRMNEAEAYTAELEKLYKAFSTWLGGWEL